MKNITPISAISLIATPLKIPGLPGHSSRGECRRIHQPLLTAAYCDGRMRKILLLTAGGAAVLLLAGCGGSSAPPVPDLVPVGDGLKVVAYALIAAAVIITLGKLLP